MLSDVPLSLTPTEGGKGLLNLAGDAIKVCVRVRPLSTLEPIHSRARARVVERWGVVIVWDWTGLGGEGCWECGWLCQVYMLACCRLVFHCQHESYPRCIRKSKPLADRFVQ